MHVPENFLELHYKKCTDGAIFPEIDTIPASRSLVLHVEVIYTLETGREKVCLNASVNFLKYVLLWTGSACLKIP
jgi:hypothetical protein